MNREREVPEYIAEIRTELDAVTPTEKVEILQLSKFQDLMCSEYSEVTKSMYIPFGFWGNVRLNAEHRVFTTDYEMGPLSLVKAVRFFHDSIPENLYPPGELMKFALSSFVTDDGPLPIDIGAIADQCTAPNETLDDFDHIVTRDYQRLTDYLLDEAGRIAVSGESDISTSIMRAIEYANLGWLSIDTRVKEIVKIFETTLLNDRARGNQELANRILTFNPKTEHIEELAFALEMHVLWSQFNTQPGDFDVVEELGSTVYLQFAEFIKRFIDEPDKDRNRHESLMSHYILTAIRIVQCTNQPETHKHLNELIELVLSKQSPQGQGLTRYIVDKSRWREISQN